MGHSSTELINHTTSDMETEHGVATNGDIKTHPPVISITTVHISSSGKKPGSSSFASSSSPDSPLEDPFQDDDDIELYEFSPDTTHGENVQLSSKITGDAPGLSLNNNVSTIESSPPMQTMDRSEDSSYRIPYSVFARTKSTTPMEWSVASNESLFSIHMGNNMSFSKDHMFWRSGELGLPGEVSTYGQFFNYSPNPSPTIESNENGKGSEGYSVAEAAVETMKEVLRENAEEDQSSKSLSIATSISHHSCGSATSIQSFAFPILTGDIEEDTSVKISSSVKVGPEHPQTQTEPHPIEPGPKTPSETPEKALTTWFSCFSCCPLRS